MATYDELRDIVSSASGEPLRKKVEVAIVIKAHALLNLASPTAGQIAWALAALQNPASKVTEVLHYLIAANAGATVAQITGASDATVQTHANAAVDGLVS